MTNQIPRAVSKGACVRTLFRLSFLVVMGDFELSHRGRVTRDGAFTSHCGPGEGALRERGGDQNGPQIVSPSHRCRIEHTRPPEPDKIANRFFSP